MAEATNEVTGAVPSLARRLLEVIWVFLPFGWVAFGGPQAHIALLHERFVERRHWLDEQRFVELLGLGQGLPGPTSTQMVVAVGTARAGPLGGLLALTFFLLPAAVIMGLAGLGVSEFLTASNRPVWLDGIQPATVALVAVAAWRLGLAVVKTRTTIILMLLGGAAATLWPLPWVFPAALILGGLVSVITLRRGGSDLSPSDPGVPLANLGISRLVGGLLLATFFLLLFGLILARLTFPELNQGLFGLFESFYRMGSLIFGGGQVVLPMMLTEVVNTGLVTEQEFLDGFALMLALPGPMFAFSGYLGAVAAGPSGLLVALVGLFLPGVLIIFAVLPFWERVRQYSWVRQVLVGVNATAIGLVVAAVFMLWERADPDPSGAVIALLAFGALGFLKVPAPLVIVGAGALGWVFSVAGPVLGL
jgi:chromate transporter